MAPAPPPSSCWTPTAPPSSPHPTSPTTNTWRLNANATKAVSDTLTLQALVYYSNTAQRVANGNTPNVQICNAGSGLGETESVTPLTDRNGAPIPDFLNGRPYSQLHQRGGHQRLWPLAAGQR